jgi:hypothetical protein
MRMMLRGMPCAPAGEGRAMPMGRAQLHLSSKAHAKATAVYTRVLNLVGRVPWFAW